MSRQRKRSVGQRQAAWLLAGGGTAFRDPGKELPVVELPSWIPEPGAEQRSETATVPQFGDSGTLTDNIP